MFLFLWSICKLRVSSRVKGFNLKKVYAVIREPRGFLKHGQRPFSANECLSRDREVTSISKQISGNSRAVIRCNANARSYLADRNSILSLETEIFVVTDATVAFVSLGQQMKDN